MLCLMDRTDFIECSILQPDSVLENILTPSGRAHKPHFSIADFQSYKSPAVYVIFSFNLLFNDGSRDRRVDIETGYELDRGAGVRVPVESRIFSSLRRPDRLWGSPNLLSNEFRGLFQRGVKRPEREASTGVKKMWIYTSTLHTPPCTGRGGP
jgi:hypothetical protein